MSENVEKVAVEKAEVVKETAKTDKGYKKKKKEKKDRKHPFGEMISELKKVSWPTKEELRTYSICVLVFVLVSAVLLGVMDVAVSALMKYISEADKLPSVLNGLFGG